MGTDNLIYQSRIWEEGRRPRMGGDDSTVDTLVVIMAAKIIVGVGVVIMAVVILAILMRMGNGD